MFARVAQPSEPREGEEEPPLGVRTHVQHLRGHATGDEEVTVTVAALAHGESLERVLEEQFALLMRLRTVFSTKHSFAWRPA